MTATTKIRELASDKSANNHDLGDEDSFYQEQRLTVDDSDNPQRGEFGKLYELTVDKRQQDRATQIKFHSFKRPHMRAFHFAWLGFFLAFNGWFAIPPLLTYIKKDLKLVQGDVDTSNITSVSSTIFARIALGPLCDRYGPRIVYSILLVVGAIPIGLAGLVNSAEGLQTVRFFIGFIGAAFVCCQFWTSNMFSKEIVGTANAFAGGWGNLGAGVTYLLMPVIYDLFHDVFGVPDHLAWRVVLIIPAVFLVICGIFMYFFTDDCPYGNYNTLPTPFNDHKKKSQGSGRSNSAIVALKHAALNHNTYLLALVYAACFGVELMVDNAIGQYFYEDFTRKDCDPAIDEFKCRVFHSVTTTQHIGAIFGLMNIFSRPTGGMLSDYLNKKFGMRGRLWILFVLLFLEGITLMIFSQLHGTAGALITLILFSYCCQAACGATFGVVPYVEPLFMASVSGIVGAGGNAGAFSWGFLFKYIGNRRKGFFVLGAIVTGISFLVFGVYIRGLRSMLFNAKAKTSDDRTVHVDDISEETSPLPENMTTSLQQVGNKIVLDKVDLAPVVSTPKQLLSNSSHHTQRISSASKPVS